MRLNYIIIPAIVFGVAVLCHELAFVGIDRGWYGGIITPNWMPRTNVIAAIWSVIYALVAMSILLVWNRSVHDSRFRHIVAAFVLNGMLSVGWNYAFFMRHALGLSPIIAIVMWFSVVELMVSLWPVKKISSLLLIPYAVWLVAVAVVSYMIWQLN